MQRFKLYHLLWLREHPTRSEEWLRERLRDGFDVHHLDGNHSNNDPMNLVLIECLDHMRLHGSTFNRMARRNLNKTKPTTKESKRMWRLSRGYNKKWTRIQQLGAANVRQMASDYAYLMELNELLDAEGWNKPV